MRHFVSATNLLKTDMENKKQKRIFTGPHIFHFKPTITIIFMLAVILLLSLSMFLIKHYHYWLLPAAYTIPQSNLHIHEVKCIHLTYSHGSLEDFILTNHVDLNLKKYKNKTMQILQNMTKYTSCVCARSWVSLNEQYTALMGRLI